MHIPPFRITFLAISAFLLAACTPQVIVFSPSNVLQAQSGKETLSTKHHFPSALNAAQGWKRDALLTGAYSLRLGGRPFLSYSFMSPSQLQNEFAVKIESNLKLSSKLSAARGRSTPLKNTWNLDVNEVLRLAEAHGFTQSGDQAVGLNDFSGMGIPNEGPKWSVMSFNNPKALTFYVIDDKSKEVWTCENATATSGCQQIRAFLMPLREAMAQSQ